MIQNTVRIILLHAFYDDIYPHMEVYSRQTKSEILAFTKQIVRQGFLSSNKLPASQVGQIGRRPARKRAEVRLER